MAETQEIRFRCDTLFTGETGEVDAENCIIKGVSVITGGVEAEGHALQVDDTTLSQLQSCAKAKGKIPVNLDHGTGVKDLNGYLCYFRMDGNKLRADWHLLRTHAETPMMLERADVMPNCFGLSVAFKGPPKGVPTGGGKMAARCEKLLSVDCVTRPAANDGLFSAVDNENKSMANENQDQGKEPTPAEIMKAITDLSGRLDKQDEFNQQITDHLNGQGEDDIPSLEEIAQMDDEQLKALGITREEVQAAVDEYNAGVSEGGEDGGEDGDGDGDGTGVEGAAAMAGVETSAAGSGSTDLKALQREVVALKKKQSLVELKAKTDAENIELAAIEDKVLVIAEQRDRAIELAENYKAECEALRLAVKTGTRPVKAGVDNGMRMFSVNGSENGQLHEFQVRVKQLTQEGKTEAQAITFAQKENPASHADWLQSLRKQPVIAD